MFTRLMLRSVVFPLLERVTKSRFWSYYRHSLRYDRLRTNQRDQIGRERLSRLLNAALHSALQRERLERAGLATTECHPDAALELLARLPPLSKQEFRRHFPGGTTTSAIPDDWRYISTSGTLDRMTVVADFIKRDHLRSSELRVLRTVLDADVAVNSVEVPPNACNVVCGIADVGPPTFLSYFWKALRRGKLFTAEAQSDLRGRFERQYMLPRTTLLPVEPAPVKQLLEVLDGHLREIDRVEPTLLRAYPIYLLWLAERYRDSGRTNGSLRLICPFGGLASPALVARSTQGFGAAFANIYGTSELGSVAASCGQSPGMHVFEDQFIVEVLAHGRPVEAGKPGRLVVTDLTNTAMPLIRYEVGDVGCLYRAPCPCGRTTVRLEVLGRTQEVLTSPHGPLTSSDVADSFFADPAIANFRLEEPDPGTFEATIVGGWNNGAPDVEAWKDRFARLHGGANRLRTRLVPFIRPEASGKYRFIQPYPRGAEAL
jgi:phenylacetate-CoA ligase